MSAYATPIPYCPLPLGDTRRGYVKAEDTDVARAIEEHAPILVSGIGDIRDDYETVEQHDWLSAPGGFR